MDVKTFTDDLLSALAGIESFGSIAIQAEGPIVSGNAFLTQEFFLRFYFNEVTGTLAFALIERQQRIWGVDYDNRRGWHIHPIDHPNLHLDTRPLSIPEIIEQLEKVVSARD